MPDIKVPLESENMTDTERLPGNLRYLTVSILSKTAIRVMRNINLSCDVAVVSMLLKDVFKFINQSMIQNNGTTRMVPQNKRETEVMQEEQ